MDYPSKIDPRLCVVCRGGKYLCGLAYCPIVVKSSIYSRLEGLENRTVIEGSTPPSVFIGRTGYPKVRAGPVAPPLIGDTSIFDYPETWLNMKLEDILNYRFSMIRGYKLFNITDIYNRDLQALQELTLSFRPIDIEIEMEKPVGRKILLDEHVPPLGPSSPYRRLLINSNPNIPRQAEKAYYDTDLKANEAVIYLYTSGLPVSYIQKVLSVGALGSGKNRRLVPTRWSITAVDDVISKHLLSKIKQYPEIDGIYVYILNVHLNLFIGILMPREWSYEWGEAWFPGSTWNPAPYGQVYVETDWELHMGRKNYASTGGCYYAARLAVAEHLYKIKRQATVILWREIYPGFNIPVGVWFVRESVRKMFSQNPYKVDNLQEAFDIINKHSRIGVHRWISSSKLISYLRSQRRIEDWVVKPK